MAKPRQRDIFPLPVKSRLVQGAHIDFDASVLASRLFSTLNVFTASPLLISWTVRQGYPLVCLLLLVPPLSARRTSVNVTLVVM